MLEKTYKRQRELHGGLRIAGHWVLLGRLRWGKVEDVGVAMRVLKIRETHSISRDYYCR
jgi:hypothetical protein